MRDRTKNKIYLVVFFVFLVSFALLKFSQRGWREAHIQVGEEQLFVAVADTPERRYKGLGGRESLDPYDGMLFVFDRYGKYQFVMRDTRFSIDIIWFKDGSVVDVAPNVAVEPDVAEWALTRYGPRDEANIVLEVPAGWSAKHGIGIGTKLRILSD